MADSSTSIIPATSSTSLAKSSQSGSLRSRMTTERDRILTSTETRSEFLQDIIQLCLALETIDINRLNSFTDKYSGIVKTQGITTVSPTGDAISETKLTSLAAFATLQHRESMLRVKTEVNELSKYDEAVKQAPTEALKAQVLVPETTLPAEIVELLTDPKHLINGSETILDILNKIKEEEIRLSLSVEEIFRPTQNLKDLLMIGKIIGSEQLTTLNLPNVTRVYCYGCIGLTQLTASVATKIYCSGCTNLTQLDASVATKVYCPGCTGLSKATIETLRERGALFGFHSAIVQAL